VGALIATSTALAGTVNEYFGDGVLGLRWGTTLLDVQSKFPRGLTYTTPPDRRTGIIYQVSLDADALGFKTPPMLALFEFTKSEKLREASFHFHRAESETVLYQVALALGQDYSIEEGPKTTSYLWKPGRTSDVFLSIGRAPPYEWAVLDVECIVDVER
jgi:hypothetical protein